MSKPRLSILVLFGSPLQQSNSPWNVVVVTWWLVSLHHALEQKSESFRIDIERFVEAIPEQFTVADVVHP